MKIARLPIQVIAILLQIYFIVETIRLHTCGYVVYMGEPIESSWFSMLFTLVIVTGCEILSLIDAILFVISKKKAYSIIYLLLVVLNAFLFMTMAYYSDVGTMICMSFYALLFVLRIINFVRNSIEVLTRS